MLWNTVVLALSMPSASPLRVGAIALAVLLGCSSQASLPKPSGSSALSPPTDSVPYTSPPIWRYHPRKAARPAAHYELDRGRALYAGARGERWLRDERLPELTAAAELAPEDLIAIARLGGDGWVFVGESGTSYEAKDPLGRFVRSTQLSEPLSKVTVAGASIIGIRRDGALMSSLLSDSNWKRAGPTDRRFVDVVGDPSGVALALAIPEELWSFDLRSGLTGARVDVDSIGALKLLRDSRDGMVVESVFGLYGWQPPSGASTSGRGTSNDPEHLVPLGRRPVIADFKLDRAPRRGPDASALRQGRAIFTGERYLEVVNEQGRGKLLSGPLDGALEMLALEEADACESVRIAGFKRWVYLACTRVTGKDAVPYEFYRSSDGGKRFHREPYQARAKSAELMMSVGEVGALVVTGVCSDAGPASGARSAKQGCLPDGLYYRGLSRPEPKPRNKRTGADGAGSESPLDKTVVHLLPSATAALKGSAEALAFSTDGRVAYAVGRTTKSSAVSMFVSHDGARTFEAHELAQYAPSRGEEARAPSPSVILSAVPAEDGTVAVVMAGDQLGLVVTDDDGRALSAVRAPSEATALGAAGSRAFAFGPGGRAWESLDAGASWTAVAAPPPQSCSEEGCYKVLYCVTVGCVLGSDLSRIGWQAEAEPSRRMLPPAVSTSRLRPRPYLTPITCTLSSQSWQPLEGVSTPPNARQSAIGKAVWFAVATDWRRASAWLWLVRAGAGAVPERAMLLPPVSHPEGYALAVVDQVEGAAALRYVVPESRPGQTHLIDLEVAWSNLFEGNLAHARLGDGGAYMPGDYSKVAESAQRANPDLLSIASRGVYLRPHAAPASRQTTWFFDGRSTFSVPPLDWPPIDFPSQRTEMAHVDGDHVPLMLLGKGVGVVRARRQAKGWTFDAYATGSLSPENFGLEQDSDVVYAPGGRAALHVELHAADSSYAAGSVFPIRASGKLMDATLLVPTQLDATKNPERCTSSQRQDTPRVVVPPLAGTRHPVIVTDSAEPIKTLLSSFAVMRGSPGSACLDVLDAEAVGPPEANGGEQAVLPYDDLEHSWLFRPSGLEEGSQRVQCRPMSCRLDPSIQQLPAPYLQAPPISGNRSQKDKDPP